VRCSCIKFDRARGYGFAVSATDPTLPDIFVHFSVIEPTAAWARKFLLPGMELECDVEPDPRDPERLVAKSARVIPPIQIAVQRSAPPNGGRS
jgi:cold shock CspA family protein